MATTNPFTPTFGLIPNYMAGRQMILGDMQRAFEDGRGNPNLSTILIGARGTGKTALLARIREESLECGWIAVENAKRDMEQHVLTSTPPKGHWQLSARAS